MKINGIEFTNVPNKKLGTKISSVLTQSGYNAESIEDFWKEGFPKLMSAIDLDWNGIKIDEDTTRSDTFDLLKLIISMKEEIEELKKKVEGNIESEPEVPEDEYEDYEEVKDASKLEELANDSEEKDIKISNAEVINAYGTKQPYFKNVAVTECEVSSTVNIKALENITFDNIKGSGDKGNTNGKINFSCDTLNIKNIKDIEKDSTIYNLFEGSQSLTDAKYNGLSAATVENVEIDCPSLTHNILNIYTPADGCEVLFKDCKFNLTVDSSNPLRMANYKNAKNVHIVFENVEWNYEEGLTTKDWKWAGLMIYQPASKDKALAGDYEALKTWKIEFKNCKYNGKLVDSINTGEHNQIIYFYNCNGDGECKNPLEVVSDIEIEINGKKQTL